MLKFNIFTILVAFWALQTVVAVVLMVLAFYRRQRYAAAGIAAGLVIFLLAALPVALPILFGGGSILGTNFSLPLAIVIYLSAFLLIVISAIERRWTLFILALVTLGAPIGCSLWQGWWDAGLFAVISYNIVFLGLYWILSTMSQIQAVLAPILAVLAGRALFVFIASRHPKERTT